MLGPTTEHARADDWTPPGRRLGSRGGNLRGTTFRRVSGDIVYVDEGIMVCAKLAASLWRHHQLRPIQTGLGGAIPFGGAVLQTGITGLGGASARRSHAPAARRRTRSDAALLHSAWVDFAWSASQKLFQRPSVGRDFPSRGRMNGWAGERLQRPPTSLAAARQWSGAGSNRRHRPFQGRALPTELPDHRVAFRPRSDTRL